MRREHRSLLGAQHGTNGNGEHHTRRARPRSAADNREERSAACGASTGACWARNTEPAANGEHDQRARPSSAADHPTRIHSRTIRATALTIAGAASQSMSSAAMQPMATGVSVLASGHRARHRASTVRARLEAAMPASA